jgi:hypothetical protein
MLLLTILDCFTLVHYIIFLIIFNYYTYDKITYNNIKYNDLE